MSVELDEQQQAVRDAILGGPRGTSRQDFDLVGPDGELRGPFGLMVRFPEVGGPLQELGAALRYRTDLTDREREIAILTVAAVTENAFERYAHERVGRAVGLSPEEIRALRHGPVGADGRERDIAALSRHLAHRPALLDGEVEQLSTRLDESTVAQVVVLVGYYRTLAQLMEAFGVGAPTDAS